MRQKPRDKNIVLDMDLDEFCMLAAMLGALLEEHENESENKRLYTEYILRHYEQFHNMISRVGKMMTVMRAKP